MVRDADNDCHADGMATIPAIARAKIDAAIAKAGHKRGWEVKRTKMQAVPLIELNWSNPYMGVSHADHPTMRRFATVDARDGFSEWWCYSWDTNTHYAHGKVHGAHHEDRAKRAAEQAI
jgi:hypothetical protein